jgi:predicted dehydrogenase
MALSVNSGTKALQEIDESTAAILRFDGERIASFVTSFNAASTSAYRVVGTKGSILVDPAYEYAGTLAYALTVNGRTTRFKVPKRDQFGPQLQYFSDCILKNREPEPSGEEGLQDVRIVEALYDSAESGWAIRVPAMFKAKRPTGKQKITKPGIRKPRTVKVQSANTEQ